MLNNLSVISEETMDWLHEASLKILAETGIVFNHQDALATFKKCGAKVENKTVYLPPHLIQEALNTAPEVFRWQARNDVYSLIVGGTTQKAIFQPNGGPVFIQDLDAGRRAATLKDFANIIKLCHAGDVVDLLGSFPVDPADVAQEHKHLFMMYETIRNTDKPIVAFQTDGPKAKQILKMVDIAMGGNDYLKENHCVALGIDPLSPLSYESVACETIIEFARQRQPIFFTVAVMAGFTGPIDLIGTVLLQNAECLAGMTLAQLINPGSPVIYSTGSTVANMKNGTFSTGSPEMMLIQLAGIQLGRDYYRLPTRSMCGMTDSKIVDYQAGFETMQNLIVGVLGGAHLIFECLGVLDAIMTTSYEKLILDLEIISRVMRIREGMDAGEKEQALASIQAVGPGGSFVTHIDTLTRYRNRWQPTLSNWESYENWRKAGGEDVVVKANRKYKEMLAAAPESLLDPDTDKALRKFIHQCIQQ